MKIGLAQKYLSELDLNFQIRGRISNRVAYYPHTN